jgi:hypothetical protein
VECTYKEQTHHVLEESRVLGHGAMLGLVRVDVSEEHVASIFRVERIRELGAALTVG